MAGNTRYKLGGLFRQSVFGRLAGYEDVNDAERLARDPTMRAIIAQCGYNNRDSRLAIIQTTNESPDKPVRCNLGADCSHVLVIAGLPAVLKRRIISIKRAYGRCRMKGGQKPCPLDLALD